MLFLFDPNRLPSCDPMFSEINEPHDGYYEVGGISRVEYEMLADGTGKIHQFDEYQAHSQPSYTGSLREIAKAMFLDVLMQSPKYGWAGPFKITFTPYTKVEYSGCAIPYSRHQKVDTEKFRADLEIELDKLRIFIPFS